MCLDSDKLCDHAPDIGYTLRRLFLMQQACSSSSTRVSLSGCCCLVAFQREISFLAPPRFLPRVRSLQRNRKTVKCERVKREYAPVRVILIGGIVSFFERV